MLGPVFYLEILLGSRRGRLDLLRRIYAACLAVEFICFFANYLSEQGLSSSSLQFLGLANDPLGRFVNSYLSLFVVQHFLLLLLTTPVFTAGAITDEKMRGTLQYLLTADLTSWEIIFGKLLGRMAQVGLIALAGLPLISFMVAYGNLDWTMILALVVVTAAPLFVLGALSLLVSVWCRKTSEAVLCVYVMLAAGAAVIHFMHDWVETKLNPLIAGGKSVGILERVLYFLDNGLRCLDPFYVLEPVWDRNDPGATAWRLLAAVLTWGAIGAASLGLATWQLRPAYFRQMEQTVRKSFWPIRKTRTVDEDDPIAWIEREVEGLAPLPWLRGMPLWLGMAVVAGATIPFEIALGVSSCLIFLVIATLVVGIRASTVVSGQRERQTWETILLSPLSTKEIVRGLHRGIFQSAYPYLIAYALPALFLGAALGEMRPVKILFTLAAAWPAMHFVAALGLWFSLSSRSSWRSLLATIMHVFGYFVLILLGTSPILGCIVGAILMYMAVSANPISSFDTLALCLCAILRGNGTHDDERVDRQG